MLVKLAAIFFSMILVNNYVLVKFYGICPFLGVSKKLDSSIGMSGAVIFVMFMATAVTFPIQIFILDPAGLSYLQTIVFILVIAVLVQVVVTNTGLHRDDIVYERSNTWIAPDSGDTSGSRQTLITGEACRRACEKLMEDRQSGLSLQQMKGRVYYGEYLAKTDPLGADVPNPVSHVAYGYATQMCILDKKTGRVEHLIAAHDVGKAVNPLSCEGQIEGGVVMSMGYALREKYPIDDNCKPIEKYGSLGLFRAHELPEITALVIDKPGLKVACGAIGIGEITSIPTAPAIADAYYRLDGERRYSLPLCNTPYERKE